MNSGACLSSLSSPHLSALSRPGVNLQSSSAGPYLNTVSCFLHLSYSHLTAILLFSSAEHILHFHSALFDCLSFYLYYFFVEENKCFHCLLIGHSLFVCVFCICVCLVISFRLCACMSMWSFGNLGSACVLGRCPSHQSIWHQQLSE